MFLFFSISSFQTDIIDLDSSDISIAIVEEILRVNDKKEILGEMYGKF